MNEDAVDVKPKKKLDKKWKVLIGVVSAVLVVVIVLIIVLLSIRPSGVTVDEAVYYQMGFQAEPSQEVLDSVELPYSAEEIEEFRVAGDIIPLLVALQLNDNAFTNRALFCNTSTNIEMKGLSVLQYSSYCDIFGVTPDGLSFYYTQVVSKMDEIKTDILGGALDGIIDGIARFGDRTLELEGKDGKTYAYTNTGDGNKVKSFDDLERITGANVAWSKPKVAEKEVPKIEEFVKEAMAGNENEAVEVTHAKIAASDPHLTKVGDRFIVDPAKNGGDAENYYYYTDGEYYWRIKSGSDDSKRVWDEPRQRYAEYIRDAGSPKTPDKATKQGRVHPMGKHSVNGEIQDSIDDYIMLCDHTVLPEYIDKETVKIEKATDPNLKGEFYTIKFDIKKEFTDAACRYNKSNIIEKVNGIIQPYDATYTALSFEIHYWPSAGVLKKWDRTEKYDVSGTVPTIGMSRGGGTNVCKNVFSYEGEALKLETYTNDETWNSDFEAQQR